MGCVPAGALSAALTHNINPGLHWLFGAWRGVRCGASSLHPLLASPGTCHQGQCRATSAQTAVLLPGDRCRRGGVGGAWRMSGPCTTPGSMADACTPHTRCFCPKHPEQRAWHGSRGESVGRRVLPLIRGRRRRGCFVTTTPPRWRARAGCHPRAPSGRAPRLGNELRGPADGGEDVGPTIAVTTTVCLAEARPRGELISSGGRPTATAAWRAGRAPSTPVPVRLGFIAPGRRNPAEPDRTRPSVTEREREGERGEDGHYDSVQKPGARRVAWDGETPVKPLSGAPTPSF